MIVCTRVRGVVVDLLLDSDDVDLAWSVREFVAEVVKTLITRARVGWPSDVPSG